MFDLDLRQIATVLYFAFIILKFDLFGRIKKGWNDVQKGRPVYVEAFLFFTALAVVFYFYYLGYLAIQNFKWELIQK